MHPGDDRSEIDRDDALMRRVRARDADALRTLADLHGHVPFRIACRMLGDASEAEDIAQEALVRLWSHADRWIAGHAVAAWLTRVATNLCLDRLRRTRRLSGEAVPEQIDRAPLADAAIAAENVRSAVVDCIAALPERQRAAIVLTYYEQQPNRGVADMLEMQLKAFESMLLRARHALQGCIEGKGVVRADISELSA